MKRHAVFTTMGASNYRNYERPTDDFYATDPLAVEKLLEVEKFHSSVYEPACGMGHISKVLSNHGYAVKSTDLIYRGYGEFKPVDFLTLDWHDVDIDIITNPPYSHAEEFVRKAIDVVAEGRKVAMLLKIQFLESQKRKALFEEYPPRTVYVFSKRVACAKNGDFNQKLSSAMFFAWFVWEKRYKGKTYIKWL